MLIKERKPEQNSFGGATNYKTLRLPWKERVTPEGTGIVRVIGPSADDFPFYVDKHYIKVPHPKGYPDKETGKLMKSHSEVCRKSFDKNAECLYCHYAVSPTEGGAGAVIGGAVTYAAMAVIHHSFYHSFKTGGDTRFENCTMTNTCPWCLQGNQANFAGVKVFEQSNTAFYKEMLPWIKSIGKRCMSCGGKLSIQAFVCEECGNPVHFIPADDTVLQGRSVCRNCNKEVPVSAQIGCLNPDCKNPVSGDIFNMYFQITRTAQGPTGNATQYAYNFLDDTMPFSALDPQFAQYKAPNFMEIFRPKSLDEQAMLLKLPNVFAHRAPAAAYTPGPSKPVLPGTFS